MPDRQVLFSGPLPALSNQLNAYVTMLTCQWLMGPCQARLAWLPLAPFTDLRHDPGLSRCVGGR